MENWIQFAHWDCHSCCDPPRSLDLTTRSPSCFHCPGPSRKFQGCLGRLEVGVTGYIFRTGSNPSIIPSLPHPYPAWAGSGHGETDSPSLSWHAWSEAFSLHSLFLFFLLTVSSLSPLPFTARAAKLRWPHTEGKTGLNTSPWPCRSTRDQWQERDLLNSGRGLRVSQRGLVEETIAAHKQCIYSDDIMNINPNDNNEVWTYGLKFFKGLLYFDLKRHDDKETDFEERERERW